MLSDRRIEWLCKDIPLPIGFENTRKFLEPLGKRFDCEKKIEDIIEKGEKMVIQNLRRRGLEVEFFHKASTAIVADSTIGIPLLRFVTEDLEMIPELVLLRSDTSRALAEQQIRELHLVSELEIPLFFEVITPVLEYRMTDRAYFGYEGMLNLIEIMQNQWWNRWKSKHKRHKSKW